MDNRIIERHQTIMDILAYVLARDPNVQEFLREYNHNRQRLVEYVLEDILNNIDQLVQRKE